MNFGLSLSIFSLISFGCGGSATNIHNPDSERANRGQSRPATANSSAITDPDTELPSKTSAEEHSRDLPKAPKELPGAASPPVAPKPNPETRLAPCPRDTPKINPDSGFPASNGTQFLKMASIRIPRDSPSPAVFTISEETYPSLDKICVTLEGAQRSMTINIAKPLKEALFYVYGFANALAVDVTRDNAITSADVVALGEGAQSVTITVPRFADCESYHAIEKIDNAVIRCQTRP